MRTRSTKSIGTTLAAVAAEQNDLEASGDTHEVKDTKVAETETAVAEDLPTTIDEIALPPPPSATAAMGQMNALAPSSSSTKLSSNATAAAAPLQPSASSMSVSTFKDPLEEAGHNHRSLKQHHYRSRHRPLPINDGILDRHYLPGAALTMASGTSSNRYETEIDDIYRNPVASTVIWNRNYVSTIKVIVS
jgi:hypothetical protein